MSYLMRAKHFIGLKRRFLQSSFNPLFLSEKMGYYPGRKEAAVTGQGEWGGGVEGRVGWLGWNLLFF